MFQSTPPRGGRRAAPACKVTFEAFQSTPPRGGRPASGGDGFIARYVSIHAPARGATLARERRSRRSNEFQSTPPRGGRHVPVSRYIANGSFQSTPPRGGRPSRVPTFRFQSTPRRGATPTPTRAGGVSIHAPARGATRSPESQLIHVRSFQSTPPRGGRHRRRRLLGDLHTLFQSTPPRGGRRSSRRHGLATGNVSIHAPARGATMLAGHTQPRILVSIHAPARGATNASHRLSRSLA